MVALNKHFAFENPHSVEENRVGDFFGQEAKSSRVNRLSAQQPRLEKAHAYDETASGMFFYGFRYYDAETGRWPSRDPIGERGGLNLYGFVENNAVNRWDLLGLTRQTHSGRIGGPSTQGFDGYTYTYEYEESCDSNNQAKFKQIGITKQNVEGLPDSMTIVVLSYSSYGMANPDVTAKKCPKGKKGTIMEGTVEIQWQTDNYVGASYKGVGISYKVSTIPEGSDSIPIKIDCCVCDDGS
jgi:RHS repeat-associated protein